MHRINYLDTTKAIGMFLVYYGHFIQKIYMAGSTAIFSELKLIYAFHVPLFFFLAGIFWKPTNMSLALVIFNKFKTRIMPTLFFGIIAIPWFLFLDKYPIAAVLVKAKAYLIGQPELNWVTWFLVCLFTLEIIIAILAKIAPFHNKLKTLLYAAMFFVIGWILASHAEQISFKTGVPKNFWFINEAFTAGGFYLLGYWAKTHILKPTHRLLDGIAAVISGVLLLATYNLNQGTFSHQQAIVLMNASSHGNYLMFITSALLGIAFIIFAARCYSPKAFLIEFIAQNTLIYLGLNGLCLFFIDVKILYKIAYIPTDPLFINLYALVYVTTIMLIFVPATWLIKKFIPKWLVP